MPLRVRWKIVSNKNVLLPVRIAIVKLSSGACIYYVAFGRRRNRHHRTAAIHKIFQSSVFSVLYSVEARQNLADKSPHQYRCDNAPTNKVYDFRNALPLKWAALGPKNRQIFGLIWQQQHEKKKPRHLGIHLHFVRIISTCTRK